ncbi:gamma-glutamyltransferase [Agaribacterium sp. ZY112]|uniref:gamma-glutamyltransferase n=1 Tax=Agaribacterium sp. ZY112 TaxID=3233574 RepID=UPI003523845F
MLFVKKKIQYTASLLVSCCLGFYGPLVSSASDKEPDSLVSYYDLVHPIISRSGMVVSQNDIASEVGAQILREGGNAIDAAVATAFALAVTLPRAGNLGGGGMMMIHLAQENKNIALNYRELAPEAAYETMFLDKQGEPISEKSLHTLAAAGVPGTVAGMHHALTKYGTMTWSQVIAPAEKLAREGIVINDDIVRNINVSPALKDDAESCRVYFKKDCVTYKPGERLKQTDLANSLSALRKGGAEVFYHGEIAEKIVKAMKKGGGLITAEDLANYHVEELTPIYGQFRDYQIVTMPPPSSGGIHLVQMFNMLDALPLKTIEVGSALLLHYQIEIFKRAYADRSKYLGDTDFVHVPVKGLTDPAYAKQLVKNIKADVVTPSSAIKAGKVPSYESPDTTHISVMDKQGNVVSNTYTLNHSFGSGITIPGTGILMNNTMDDFSIKPGSPNSYGLIGGEANAIHAGKHPLSSMTPTIVLKQGKPFLATGTPGGSKIISSVFQQLTYILAYDVNLAEATIRPRVHHQWMPDVVYVEKSLNPDTRDKLLSMGYKVEQSKSLGSLQSVMYQEDVFFGYADPRRPHAKAVAAD